MKKITMALLMFFIVVGCSNNGQEDSFNSKSEIIKLLKVETKDKTTSTSEMAGFLANYKTASSLYSIGHSDEKVISIAYIDRKNLLGSEEEEKNYNSNDVNMVEQLSSLLPDNKDDLEKALKSSCEAFKFNDKEAMLVVDGENLSYYHLIFDKMEFLKRIATSSEDLKELEKGYSCEEIKNNLPFGTEIMD